MIQENHFINTLQGRHKIEDLVHYQFLPHEHCFQNLSERSDNQNLAICLENLDVIRMNPTSSPTNLTLNDIPLIAHEIQASEVRLIILESTSLSNGFDMQKMLELNKMLPQLIILTGYSIPKVQRNSQTLILNSKENILKKIEFEFNMGTDGIFPSFFGEMVLKDLNLNDELNLNYLECFYYFSNKFGTPIMFDLEYDSGNTMKFHQIQQKFLNQYNSAVQIISNVDVESITLTQSVDNIPDLLQFLERKSNYLIFDLLTLKLDLRLMKSLFSTFEHLKKGQCFVSPGVKYKTHLKRFGGQGYQHHISNEFSCNQLLSVFNWSIEKVMLEEKQLWRCPICKKDFDSDIEKFKKFEVEYCSIKCLREGIKNIK